MRIILVFVFKVVTWFHFSYYFLRQSNDMKEKNITSCVGKYHISARKHAQRDGCYYNKATLSSIRATINDTRKNEQNNKYFRLNTSP